jgi:putative ABC transport system permease protein
MSYYELSTGDLVIAASLVLVNGLVSLGLGLGLGRRLAIASVRTVVQLLLIGLVLEWIFGTRRWEAILVLMLVMTLIAGVSAVQRTEHRYRHIWSVSLVAVMASSWFVTAVALTAIIEPPAWRERPAQYAVTLLGMILGNSLNGISLGLDRLTGELLTGRGEVEMRLCLGATRWEAAQPLVGRAVTTGMVPMINSMMVVGLVSLPGMMTGQILAGAAPLSAVRYQIVIIFLIAAGTALGTTLAVLGAYRCLFNHHHQFLADRIRRAAEG